MAKNCCCAARGHALAVCHLLALLVRQTRSAPRNKKIARNISATGDLFFTCFLLETFHLIKYITISLHIFHYFDDIAAIF